MNSSEARIHAYNARARALSAEIDMMKVHDLSALARGDGVYAKEVYQSVVSELFAIEQGILETIKKGWL
jgi:hypothetical protein